MPGHPFDSYAQNGEDVVLWRALGDIEHGRYIDVGANDPVRDSITKAFYDAGWRGITIEPMPSFAAAHREQRPEDLLVEAAVTSAGQGTVTLHEIEGTGLSTLVGDVSSRHTEQGYDVHDIVVPARRLDDILDEAGWAGQDIHFMTVDVEAAEEDVIRSIDLTTWRPWVLVIEATAPLTTEPSHQAWEPMILGAGYDFCLFDGLSRFYLAKEHSDLAFKLSYPATLLDDFSTSASRAAGAEITRLHELVGQSNSHAERLERELAELRERHHDLSVSNHETVLELESTKQTLSWRLTRPLRALREWVLAARSR